MKYTIIFFSSRRRHTRYWRDWSSDVCSSDLRSQMAIGLPGTAEPRLQPLGPRLAEWASAIARGIDAARLRETTEELAGPRRSEERRVGKECRSRWSPDY